MYKRQELGIWDTTAVEFKNVTIEELGQYYEANLQFSTVPDGTVTGQILSWSGSAWVIEDQVETSANGLLTDQIDEITTNAGVSIDGLLIKDNAINNARFVGAIEEDIFALSGTTPALNPANGTIQTWTLTGNSTPTDSLTAGESITLMVDDGTGFTITWPTITWVGGAAPSLPTTGYIVLELWKVSTTLYGAIVGNA